MCVGEGNHTAATSWALHASQLLLCVRTPRPNVRSGRRAWACNGDSRVEEVVSDARLLLAGDWASVGVRVRAPWTSSTWRTGGSLSEVPGFRVGTDVLEIVNSTQKSAVNYALGAGGLLVQSWLSS